MYFVSNSDASSIYYGITCMSVIIIIMYVQLKTLYSTYKQIENFVLPSQWVMFYFANRKKNLCNFKVQFVLASIIWFNRIIKVLVPVYFTIRHPAFAKIPVLVLHHFLLLWRTLYNVFTCTCMCILDSLLFENRKSCNVDSSSHLHTLDAIFLYTA